MWFGRRIRSGCEGCDAMAQMAEVFRTNLKTHDLFNHGREVGQGANDPERRSVGGACQTAGRGQSQRVLHRIERHTTLVQLGGEQKGRTTDGAAGARSGAVSVKKPSKIVALLHEFSLADRAA